MAFYSNKRRRTKPATLLYYSLMNKTSLKVRLGGEGFCLNRFNRTHNERFNERVCIEAPIHQLLTKVEDDVVVGL